jgi:hypothetical protein
MMIYAIFRNFFFARGRAFHFSTGPWNDKKILYNIDLAEQTNNVRLFKKIRQDIWEFRTKYGGLQIRLLAFWDKTDKQETLVIATHGFLKKNR